MKTCPHCLKDLPDDSAFCTYCGKSLESGKRKEKEEIKLKKNPRKNSWSSLGLLLLGVGVFGFDFILSTVVAAFGGNSKFLFYISFILYIGSMICGFLSLHIDKKDKRDGYEPNGNKNYAYVSICVSLFVALLNLSQVILK